MSLLQLETAATDEGSEVLLCVEISSGTLERDVAFTLQHMEVSGNAQLHPVLYT